MCSKPEIVLAFLSKSNYCMIIVSTKQYGIFETMSGYCETKGNMKMINDEHQWSYNQRNMNEALISTLNARFQT